MFGAELYDANNDRFFSSQFKTYVYKGWLYPYYIERMQFSTPGTNNGINNTVARTHYIVPAGNYTNLVAFGTSYNNRPCLPFAVTPNPEGRTGLCNISTTTSFTSSTFTQNTNLFYDVGGLPDIREQIFRQHMNVSGTDSSYLEASKLVLNVGDVVWSSDNPSNKVTVTGISFSGGASGLQYPSISLSGPITLNAAVNTNESYSCICAEKLVNTVYICAVNFGVCGSGQGGTFNQTACKPETYPLRLFDVMSSSQATGFGMQMFDETGQPTFDSNQSILEIAATVRPTAQSYSSLSARPTFNVTSGAIPSNWAVTGSVIGGGGSGPIGTDPNYPFTSNSGYLYLAATIKPISATQVQFQETASVYGQSFTSYVQTYTVRGGGNYSFINADKYPLSAAYQLGYVVPVSSTATQ